MVNPCITTVITYNLLSCLNIPFPLGATNSKERPPYCGWTNSCTTLKPWFLGIYRNPQSFHGFSTVNGGANWFSQQSTLIRFPRRNRQNNDRPSTFKGTIDPVVTHKSHGCKSLVSRWRARHQRELSRNTSKLLALPWNSP